MTFNHVQRPDDSVITKQSNQRNWTKHEHKQILKMKRFTAEGMTVQNLCCSYMNLLKTNRFWVGGLSLGNRCFSNRSLLKTNRFCAGGLSLRNRCFSNRNLLKTNRFWAGGLTLRNEFFSSRIYWIDIYWQLSSNQSSSGDRHAVDSRFLTTVI